MAAIKSRTKNQRTLDRIICIKREGCYRDWASIGVGRTNKIRLEEVDLVGKM